MTEPTKAAMKCTEYIHQKTGGFFVSPVVIDRETGLPELIAALRWYVENDTPDATGYYRDGYEQAVAALRKAGAM